MSVHENISPRRLAELADTGSVEVIDVRTPAEFREAHLPMARNVPLGDLDAEHLRQGRNGDAEEPLYLICRSGNRSTKACEKLHAAGFVNIVNIEGGTQAWIDAGLPVVRGKKAISLERQVRIAAGAIVLVGAVLALTVHPYFAAISAFIGAGLMFAGITDTCGMAMILARMPWNRAPGAAQEMGPSCSC